MLAKQKEEMGAPLTKREKQAKSGIENITNKASFKNDQWYATCVAYSISHLMAVIISKTFLRRLKKRN